MAGGRGRAVLMNTVLLFELKKPVRSLEQARRGKSTGWDGRGPRGVRGALGLGAWCGSWLHTVGIQYT